MSRESQREKNWKRRTSRTEGLGPAQQFEVACTSVPESVEQTSPRCDDTRLNVLFICSRNQWRSPTAEKVWRSHPQLAVRSAGTSPKARRHVSPADVSWADVVLVMEEKHKCRLVSAFSRLLEHTPVHVLDIPDQYRYMDPELVELLLQSVKAVLGLEALCTGPGSPS